MNADRASVRTLSKSDYILARSCPAKLYFAEHDYPDTRDGNPYVALLANGGYMVHALAKANYPEGIPVRATGDLAADRAQALAYLQRDVVTVFEPTLAVGRRQARADIIEKRGREIRLLEVKAKSFDGAEHAASLASGGAGAFRAKRKPNPVLGDWLEKLEDLTFQVLVLERMLPGIAVRPYLVLVDTSKRSMLDDVPGLFRLRHSPRPDGPMDVVGATFVGTAEQLAQLDLLTEVDVSAEVALLRAEVDAAAAVFEANLDAPLATFRAAAPLGANCGACQFHHTDGAVEPDGFAECWGPLAAARPHLLELYSVSRAKAPDATPLVPWMIGAGTASLLDIPLDGLQQKEPNPAGVATRQRRQITCTRSGETYVSDALRAHLAALAPPVHFIDFETSRLALPYHRGMRPYGLVAFQWSCHTQRALGGAIEHRDWLNSVDVWPNQSFVESLREAIGDEGPVLTWTHFEATTLKQIIDDLDRFGRDVPALVAWMRDVVERRVVDLHDWARADYYHPGMRGRTSIKVVLDALWQADERLRGDFETWTGARADASRDPYAALPPVEIAGVSRDVHEGTGAMIAYQEMMYGAERDVAATKEKWRSLLLQYCALDTLSMVLIVEHWRRITGLAQ